MLNIRRRKAAGVAELRGRNTQMAVPALPSPLAFITTVMSAGYTPQVDLEDLVRAEREFVGEGHSFRVERAHLAGPSPDLPMRAVAVKAPADSIAAGPVDRWDHLRLEVLTLLHPPIAAHRNIVDLLAIGWEFVLSRQLLPTLILPFASWGTLDDFSKDQDMPAEWKHHICLDVARGLNVLHGCGIVHGDLKSENVLLFFEVDRPVAKLADFGCSISNPQQTGRLSGGSPPWNCPEWRDYLDAEALPLTDIYCLGLLIWRTALAQPNPFRHLPSLMEGDGDPAIDKIDALKSSSGNRFITEVRASLSVAPSHSHTETAMLSDAVNACLRHEPKERSLKDCLESLRKLVISSSQGTELLEEAGPEPFILNPEPIGSMEAMSRLPWAFQRELYLFHSSRARRAPGQGGGPQYAESQLWLFVCRLQGIGVEVSEAEACGHLMEAANHGHFVARALAHRAVFAFLDQPRPAVPQQWILRSLEMGYVGAIEDYAHFVSQSGQQNAVFLLELATHRLRCFTAGVGVGHFLEGGSRLNPLSIEKQGEFERRLSEAASRDGFDVNSFVVNSRRDRLLHLACACGFEKAALHLIRRFKGRIDVNAPNDDGETALLSASRAGQSETVRILLDNGADLRPSATGESPLHWLGAFFTESAETARLMLRSASNRQRRDLLRQKAAGRAYSQYWGAAFPAGTPLHRAVHFNWPDLITALVGLGADPDEPDGSDDSGHSALQLACGRHRAAALDAMLGGMEPAHAGAASSPLLHIALSSYSSFHALLDNGVFAREAQSLKDTVAVLLRRGADPGLLAPDDRSPDLKYTALYKAVESGSMAAVRLALSPDLLRHASFLDAPCGEPPLTPLGIAVQNGSLDVVKALLAAGAKPRHLQSGDPAARCISVLHSCALMEHSTSPATRLKILDLLAPHFPDGVDVQQGGRPATGSSAVTLESPFCLAVRLQQFDLARALLDRGADVDFELYTMVLNNAPDDREGYLDGEGLAPSGAGPEQRATILGSLLPFRMMALVPSIQFLLGYDASGKKKPDWPHKTPSPIICKASNWTVWHAVAFRRNQTLAYAGDITRETLSYLEEAYGNLGEKFINTQSRQLEGDDTGGKTALHVAAERTNTEVVARLLRLGADRNLRDNSGATPLDYALALMRDEIELDEGEKWM